MPLRYCAALLVALAWLVAYPARADSVIVKDIIQGPPSGGPTQLVNIDGVLYFQARDLNGAEELWRSDGTRAGTKLVKDIYPGSMGSRPEGFVVHQGSIYFIARDEDGDELWTTDGTAAGTVQITDINPGSGDSLMRFTKADDFWRPAMISVGQWLYFAADDGESGFELWRSDGTAAGTKRVKDIFRGPDSGIEAPRFVAVGDTLFFFAMNNLNQGIELWKSDGTAQGTVLVQSINDVPGDTAFPSPLDTDGILAATSTNVFFRGFDGSDFGLYTSDGASVTRLVETSPSGVVSPNFLDGLTVWRDLLYFRANTDGRGAELWVSDGTPAGTRILREYASENGSTVRNPTEFVPSGDYLFFACDTGNRVRLGQELCRTDGTPEGTVLVKEIQPGTGFSSPSEFVDVEGILYFTARTDDLGVELYRSDGTPQGTYLAEDLVEGSTPGNPVQLTALDRRLVYTYNDRERGTEMHRYCCDSAKSQSIAVIDDTTGNGAPDIATFRVDDADRMEIRVYDAQTGQLSVKKNNVFTSNWLENEFLAVTGAGRARGPALAVAATAADGRAGIQLRDGATGAALRNLTPRGKSWATIDTTTVPGIAARRAGALATLSRRVGNDWLALDVRDPTDNSRLAAFQSLNGNWQGLAVEALTAEGEPALAVMYSRRSDSQVRVQTRKALTGDIVGNYFLGVRWRAIEMQTLPDLDGNGVGEVATLLRRPTDGVVQIQVRDAATGALVSRVNTIGRGVKAWRIVQIRPLTFNGVPALATLATRREDGRVQVRIQNAATGAALNTVFFRPAPWELQAHFEVVPDFTGNGEPELAVPMRNADSLARVVQIRDAASGSVIRNIQLPK
jgi:ELWxxDGT repeat protein